MKKPTILALVQLPPPYHGVTAMNELFCSSPYLNEAFDIRVVRLSFALNLADSGRFRWGKIGALFKTALRLFWNLLSLRPDLGYFTLVPTGAAFYRDLLFVGIFRLFRVPTVLHLHGKGILQNSRRRVRGFFYRWAFDRNFLVHLSPGLIRDSTSLTDRSRIHHIENGIPDRLTDPSFRQILEKRSLKDRPQILYLSSMMRAKGPLVLLDALARLRRQGARFTARFAGEVVEKDIVSLFEEKIRQSELSGWVDYVGPCRGADKDRLFAESNIFVHPTYNDAFPLVILEAMQFGLPIIASREGAIPEIVDEGKIGWLINPGDSEELARYLDLFIRSVNLRVQMGLAGRSKYLKNYTDHHFEKRIYTLLSDLAQARHLPLRAQRSSNHATQS